jgi:phage FluMu gp28-like protein
VYEKSRRIGISWAQAAECALLAASDRGMDSWYVGYNQDMAREFINDCAFWGRTYQLAADEVEQFVFQDENRDIQAYRVRFASGRRVTALSSRPSNLRGKQGLVVIDEAAFHPELSELLKAALALLIWGGKVVVISTHDGTENPFNELVSDIRAGKVPYSLHRTTFDEALQQGLYRRICVKKGERWTSQGEADWREEVRALYRDAAEEELDCIPRGGGRSYLTRAAIEAAMVPAPVLRLSLPSEFAQRSAQERHAEVAAWCQLHMDPLLAELPRELRSYVGEDFGRSGDLTYLVPLLEQTNLQRRAPFVIELRNVPFVQQEQIFFRLVDGLPRFSAGCMDARGNGQYLAEVAAQRYGSRIQQVMLSQSWYGEHMPRMRAALEDRTLLLPLDADLLDDLRSIVVERGIPKVGDKRNKGSDGLDRHGDGAVAVALAYAASRAVVTPLEFQTTGEQRMTAGLDDFLGD